MSTNVINTVLHPSQINDSACGLFFHENRPNLILAKGNILEFYSVNTDSRTQEVTLEFEKNFEIFGDIARIHLLNVERRKSAIKKPLLFFITQKHQVAFIEPANCAKCVHSPSSKRTRKAAAPFLQKSEEKVTCAKPQGELNTTGALNEPGLASCSDADCDPSLTSFTSSGLYRVPFCSSDINSHQLNKSSDGVSSPCIKNYSQPFQLECSQQLNIFVYLLETPMNINYEDDSSMYKADRCIQETKVYIDSLYSHLSPSLKQRFIHLIPPLDSDASVDTTSISQEFSDSRSNEVCQQPSSVPDVEMTDARMAAGADVSGDPSDDDLVTWFNHCLRYSNAYFPKNRSELSPEDCMNIPYWLHPDYQSITNSHRLIKGQSCLNAFTTIGHSVNTLCQDPCLCLSQRKVQNYQQLLQAEMNHRYLQMLSVAGQSGSTLAGSATTSTSVLSKSALVRMRRSVDNFKYLTTSQDFHLWFDIDYAFSGKDATLLFYRIMDPFDYLIFDRMIEANNLDYSNSSHRNGNHPNPRISISLNVSQVNKMIFNSCGILSRLHSTQSTFDDQTLRLNSMFGSCQLQITDMIAFGLWSSFEWMLSFTKLRIGRTFRNCNFIIDDNAFTPNSNNVIIRAFDEGFRFRRNCTSKHYTKHATDDCSIIGQPINFKVWKLLNKVSTQNEKSIEASSTRCKCRIQIREDEDCGPFTLRTKASGSVKDVYSRTTDYKTLSALSPDHSVIALSLNEGSLKIIAVKATLSNSGHHNRIESFNVRIEPCPVLDIQFLHDNNLIEPSGSTVSHDVHSQPLPQQRPLRQTNKHVICLVYKLVDESTKVCVYGLNVRERFLKTSVCLQGYERPSQSISQKGSSIRDNQSSSSLSPREVDLTTSTDDHFITHIVPTPEWGVILLSRQFITFYPIVNTQTRPIHFKTPSDGSNFVKSNFVRKSFGVIEIKQISCWSNMKAPEGQLRLLVSDTSGNLFVIWVTAKSDLFKNKKSSQLADIERSNNSTGYCLNVEQVGKSTLASNITQLLNNYFFLSSKTADHQLIQLYRAPRHSWSSNRNQNVCEKCPIRGVRVISSFCNMAPLVDMILVPTRISNASVDISKSDCDRISPVFDYKLHKEVGADTFSKAKKIQHAADHWTAVACSNTESFGSLRFIRHSAITNEQLLFRGKHICAVFILPLVPNSESNLVVISYYSSSLLLIHRCAAKEMVEFVTESDGYKNFTSTGDGRPQCFQEVISDPKYEVIDKPDEFDFDLCHSTLLAVRLNEDLILQATTANVRVLSMGRGLSTCVHLWSPSLKRSSPKVQVSIITDFVNCSSSKVSNFVAVLNGMSLEKLSLVTSHMRVDEETHRNVLKERLESKAEISFDTGDLVECTHFSLNAGLMNGYTEGLLVCGLANKPFVYIISLFDLQILMHVNLHVITTDPVRSVATCAKTVAFVPLSNGIHLAVGDDANRLILANLHSIFTTKAHNMNWRQVELTKSAKFLKPIIVSAKVKETTSHTESDESQMANQRPALLVGGHHPLIILDDSVQDDDIKNRNNNPLTLIDINCEQILSCSQLGEDPRCNIIVKQCCISADRATSYQATLKRAFCYNVPAKSLNALDGINEAPTIEVCLCTFSEKSALHINTVRLNETPRRLTYHKSSDCIAVIVFHPFPSFQLKSYEIRERLDQCASYRAYRQCQETSGHSSFDENVSGRCWTGRGRPFAVQSIESEYRLHRPGIKRRCSKNLSDDVVDQPTNLPDDLSDQIKSDSNIHSDDPNSGDLGNFDELTKLVHKCIGSEEHAILLISRSGGLYHSFPRLHCSHFLQPSEHGLSITSWEFDMSANDVPFERQTDDDYYLNPLIPWKQKTEEYVLVGTGFEEEGVPEPEHGRLILFSIKYQKGIATLHFEDDIKVSGAVFSMAPVSRNKYLVASINYGVHLFGIQLTNQFPKLVHIGKTSTNCLSLFVKTLGDRCLVGDLVRSVEVIDVTKRIPLDGDGQGPAITSSHERDDVSSNSSGDLDIALKACSSYNNLATSLVSICRDVNPHWTSAIEIVDPDLFMFVESFNNLVMCTYKDVGSLSSLHQPRNPPLAATNSPTTTPQRDDIEEVRNRNIREVSLFHVDHFVNVIVHGSLIHSMNRYHSREKPSTFGGDPRWNPLRHPQPMLGSALSEFIGHDAQGLWQSHQGDHHNNQRGSPTKSTGECNISSLQTEFSPTSDAIGTNQTRIRCATLPYNVVPLLKLFEMDTNVISLDQLRKHLGYSMLMAASDGWIGQIMLISPELYIVLWEIQKRLEESLISIGNIGHASWRAFSSELKTENSSGFIDGCLMECLIDMDPHKAFELLKGVRIGGVTVERRDQFDTLLRIVQCLSTTH